MSAAETLTIYWGECTTFLLAADAPPVALERESDETIDLVATRLKANPKAVIVFVCDQDSLAFQKETLPLVPWYYRRQLINRRCHNAFTHTTYRGAQTIDPTTILLYGLKKESTLVHWMKRLEGRSRPFHHRILLAPTASATLFKTLFPAHRGPWVLFLAQQDSFVRQTLYENERPLYTRLIKISGTAEEIRIHIQKETDSSLHYASRLGLERRSDIALLSILPKEWTPDGNGVECYSSPTDSLTYLSIALKKDQRKNMIAPVRSEKEQRSFLFQKGVLGASLVVWGLVLMLFVPAIFSLLSLDHQRLTVGRDIAQIKAQIAELKKDTPKKGLTLLHIAGERKQLFSQTYQKPFFLIETLRKTLTNPILSFQWQAKEGHDCSVEIALKATKSEREALESDLSLPVVFDDTAAFTRATIDCSEAAP